MRLWAGLSRPCVMLGRALLMFGSSVRVFGSVAAVEGDGLVGTRGCLFDCIGRVRDFLVREGECLVGESLGGPEECSLPIS